MSNQAAKEYAKVDVKGSQSCPIVQDFFQDTFRENTSSNKTQALAKDIKMDVQVLGILNQLFARRSCNQIKFSKK